MTAATVSDVAVRRGIGTDAGSDSRLSALRRHFSAAVPNLFSGKGSCAGRKILKDQFDLQSCQLDLSGLG